MKLILAMNEQIKRLIEKYFRARLKKTLFNKKFACFKNNYFQ